MQHSPVPPPLVSLNHTILASMSIAFYNSPFLFTSLFIFPRCVDSIFKYRQVLQLSIDLCHSITPMSSGDSYPSSQPSPTCHTNEGQMTSDQI
jgi:hypothetical protein